MNDVGGGADDDASDVVGLEVLQAGVAVTSRCQSPPDRPSTALNSDLCYLHPARVNC